jgi:hypothetical protein
VYVQTVHFVGVLLVATLVVVAWPLRCLIEVFTGSWFGKNYQHQDEPGQEPVFDKPEESKNVVRRVVYEEAKVEKK